VVRGANDETPIKPDPTGALQIALTVGFTPAEFLYVGDSGTDMRTVTAAGMHPVGALWGFRSKDELISAGARALLQQPIDLLNLI